MVYLGYLISSCVMCVHLHPADCCVEFDVLHQSKLVIANLLEVLSKCFNVFKELTVGLNGRSFLFMKEVFESHQLLW